MKFLVHWNLDRIFNILANYIAIGGILLEFATIMQVVCSLLLPSYISPAKSTQAYIATCDTCSKIALRSLCHDEES